AVSPRTYAGPGRRRPRPDTRSPPAGSAGVSLIYADTSVLRPEHRNPPSPVQAARKAAPDPHEPDTQLGRRSPQRTPNKSPTEPSKVRSQAQTHCGKPSNSWTTWSATPPPPAITSTPPW